MLSITLVSAHSGRLAVHSARSAICRQCSVTIALCPPPGSCRPVTTLVFSEIDHIHLFYQNRSLLHVVLGCTSSFVFQYLTSFYTATEMVYLLIYSPFLAGKPSERFVNV